MNLAKITEGTYAYLGENDPHDGTNAGFIVTGEGVVVIDSHFVWAADLVRVIRGITPEPIKFLVNTHMHVDHTTGNQVWQKEGATIVASEVTRLNLEDWGSQHSTNFMREFDPAKAKGIEPVLPHMGFSGELVLNMGNKQMRLVHAGPGHTAGDVYVLLPRERTIFTGDLLFSHNHCVFKPYSHTNPGNWIRVIDRILDMPVDTIVPGHGPLSTKADLRAFRDYLVDFTGQIKTMIAQGKTLNEVRKGLDLSKYSHWHHQEFIPENIEMCYRIYKHTKE